MRRKVTEFRPKGQGLEKVLGQLEAAVMEVIWQSESVTVRDVYERLKAKRNIAYTTVMTIMNRLAEKNLLVKERRGLANVFRPTCTRQEFEDGVAAEVLDGLLEAYTDAAFSHFVSWLKEDESRIAELERIIQKRRGQ
ncbi:MAG: hypothetical protein PWP65_1617 [Clostridia bacterium]|nr:hypothetical protein [Clostridia bacterium]